MKYVLTRYIFLRKKTKFIHILNTKTVLFNSNKTHVDYIVFVFKNGQLNSICFLNKGGNGNALLAIIIIICYNKTLY